MTRSTDEIGPTTQGPRGGLGRVGWSRVIGSILILLAVALLTFLEPESLGVAVRRIVAIALVVSLPAGMALLFAPWRGNRGFVIALKVIAIPVILVIGVMVATTIKEGRRLAQVEEGEQARPAARSVAVASGTSGDARRTAGAPARAVRAVAPASKPEGCLAICGRLEQEEPRDDRERMLDEVSQDAYRTCVDQTRGRTGLVQGESDAKKLAIGMRDCRPVYADTCVTRCQEP